MSREQKEKVFFYRESLCLSFIPKKKIDFKKYTEVLQIIQTCGKCDARLGKVSNLFLLL